jgi:hypothetical protein
LVNSPTAQSLERYKQFFMNRLFFLILVSFAVISNSCKSNNAKSKDPSEIAKSYGIIYSSFIITNETQNNFFGKATELLGVIKNDKSALVNTRELELSLDSAKSACETRVSILNAADEIDEEIKYKAKALDFAYKVASLYKNEFPLLIKILNSKSTNRFDESQKLLLDKMKEMQKVMYECHDAGEAFRQKYDIQNTR